MLKRWEDLPDFMRVKEVRPYWESLRKKRGQIGGGLRRRKKKKKKKKIIV